MGNILKSYNFQDEKNLTLEKSEERVLYSIIHIVFPTCSTGVCDRICDEICDEICDQICGEICDRICDAFCDQVCDRIDTCDVLLLCDRVVIV